MAVNTENIRRWIEQSEIDYISQYIKAWIPFNAWYNAEYINLDSDRARINKIKGESNIIRKKFNSLMEIDGQDSQEFKSYLASLHNELEQTQIDSKEGRIWFHDIVREKNPINRINETKSRIKYFLERIDKQKLGSIEKIKICLERSDRSNLFFYTHTEYCIHHLCNQQDYKKLTDNQKENIRIFFENLNPIKIYRVIQSALKENPKNYYLCDGLHFVRDTRNSYCPSHIMYKCLIETLYQLRNVLFHGELTPNKESQKVYKNAYFCLMYLLSAVN